MIKQYTCMDPKQQDICGAFIVHILNKLFFLMVPNEGSDGLLNQDPNQHLRKSTCEK